MAVSGEGRNNSGFFFRKKGSRNTNLLTSSFYFGDTDKTENTIFKDWIFGGQETILEYRIVSTSPDISNANITGGAITNGSLDSVYVANDGWPTQPHLVTLPSNGNTTLTDAVTNNQYFSITITPNSGYKISISSLKFFVGRGGSSTPRGYAVKGSGDSYASNLSTADVTTQNPTWSLVEIDLSGISAYQDQTGALTFRFYTYTPSSAVSIDYDNLKFIGSVSSVPMSVARRMFFVS